MPVIAHHIIFSAYGFWLPNDPRGSWSKFVGGKKLYELFGPATKVSTRESVARKPHDWRSRLAAKDDLKYPPTIFTGLQAREVARAAGDVIADKDLTVWAFAVMPDHVHLVAAVHRFDPAKIVGSCRARASRRLHDAELWPQDRPVWGRGKWAVELETPDDILTRIGYVNRNPIEAGFKPQHWSFVVPFVF